MVVKFADLEGKFVAVELLDGSKLFGVVSKYSRLVLWVNVDSTGYIVDIPKEIIQRILIVM